MYRYKEYFVQKTTKFDLKFVKIVSSIVLAIIVISSVSFALSNTFEIEDNHAVPISVYVGDQSDVDIQLATNTFSNNFKKGSYLDIRSDPFKIDGKLIIFAHGDENGLVLNKKVFLWSEIAQFIEASPSTRIYIMACFSNNILPYLSDEAKARVIGINGEVDAVIAGAIPVFFETNSLKIFSQVTNLIADRMSAITSGKIQPKFLANTESGCNLAIRKQYRSKSKWGITYHKENILWINIGELPEEFFEIGYHAGLEVIFAYIEGAIALSTIAIIVVVLLVYAFLIESTAYNRIRHDYMFGASGILIPVPSTASWFDYGKDGYRSDRKFSYATPNPAGAVLYAALSSVSSSWHCFNYPELPPPIPNPNPNPGPGPF